MKILVILVTLLSSITATVAAQAPVQLTPEEQALMEAAYAGNLDEVERLVSEGAAVDVFDPEHRTPMMFAAFNGHTPVVGYFLEKGAQVDTKDISGRTALMYAAAEGQLKVVKVLLENNADWKMIDIDGDTAKKFAANNGHRHVVELIDAYAMLAGKKKATSEKGKE